MNGDDNLAAAAQAAEEVAKAFHPPVFLQKKVLPLLRLLALAEAGTAIDPGTADVAADIAGGDADFGIVTNSFDLPTIGKRVDIKYDSGLWLFVERRRTRLRMIHFNPRESVTQRRCRSLREPYCCPHSDTALAKGFQADVSRADELGYGIGHRSWVLDP